MNWQQENTPKTLLSVPAVDTSYTSNLIYLSPKQFSLLRGIVLELQQHK